MADQQKLEAVLAKIRDEPETWKQNYWATKTECGTSYCFAGHAVAMFATEYEVKWEQGDKPYALTSFVTRRDEQGPHYEMAQIRDLAVDILGLTHDQANVLFDGGNDFAAVEAVVKEIGNGVTDFRKLALTRLVALYGEEDANLYF